MKTFNKITLMGLVGKDAESITKGTTQFVQFSVSVDNSYKKKDGSWENRSDWFQVSTAFENLMEKARELKSGDFVRIEGKMTSNKKADQSGKEITYWNVQPSEIDVILTKAERDTLKGGQANAYDDLPAGNSFADDLP